MAGSSGQIEGGVAGARSAAAFAVFEADIWRNLRRARLAGQSQVCRGFCTRDKMAVDNRAASGKYSRAMSGARKSGDDSDTSRELTVLNKLGIHARPAAMFVKTANKVACDVFVEKDGERVNGKSIMGLMMLAAGPGTKLTIIAEGTDGCTALDAIEELLFRKFDEE